MELACSNDGEDHEVMYRWCQLTLAESEGLRMWEWWGWSMWADCWGWVPFSANACVWICWRWGTFMGVEWAIMGTFWWEPVQGQERHRYKGTRPNLVCVCVCMCVVGFGKWERATDRKPSFVTCLECHTMVNDSMVAKKSNSHHWSPGLHPQKSQIYCLIATKLVCRNDGECDDKVMWWWRQLTLVEWGRLMMWEQWNWCVLVDCWG